MNFTCISALNQDRGVSFAQMLTSGMSVLSSYIRSTLLINSQFNSQRVTTYQWLVHPTLLTVDSPNTSQDDARPNPDSSPIKNDRPPRQPSLRQSTGGDGDGKVSIALASDTTMRALVQGEHLRSDGSLLVTRVPVWISMVVRMIWT